MHIFKIPRSIHIIKVIRSKNWMYERKWIHTLVGGLPSVEGQFLLRISCYFGRSSNIVFFAAFISADTDYNNSITGLLVDCSQLLCRIMLPQTKRYKWKGTLNYECKCVELTTTPEVSRTHTTYNRCVLCIYSYRPIVHVRTVIKL